MNKSLIKKVIGTFILAILSNHSHAAWKDESGDLDFSGGSGVAAAAALAAVGIGVWYYLRNRDSNREEQQSFSFDSNQPITEKIHLRFGGKAIEESKIQDTWGLHQNVYSSSNLFNIIELKFTF